MSRVKSTKEISKREISYVRHMFSITNQGLQLSLSLHEKDATKKPFMIHQSLFHITQQEKRAQALTSA